MRFPPSLLDDIRARVPISDVIGRRVTWDKQKTQPKRGDYWACCPFHGERSASFHCENRKGRYHCFGCGASGDHFKFLVECEGLSFPDAVAELAQLAGIPMPKRERVSGAAMAERQVRHELQRKQSEQRNESRSRSIREIAHTIWREGVPIGGTIAERYLRGRGIDIDLGFPSLRFIESLGYPQDVPRQEWETWPALVCAVQGPDDRFRGIWRIYLNGEGGKAPVENPKQGLGQCLGGAVWFGKPCGPINVCEGVETALAVRALTGGETVAAALSTSFMRGFIVPDGVTLVRIWPDGDTDKIRPDPRGGGERTLPSPGVTAAKDLYARLASEGRQSSVQPPPRHGRDFLDTYVAMKGKAA